MQNDKKTIILTLYEQLLEQARSYDLMTGTATGILGVLLTGLTGIGLVFHQSNPQQSCPISIKIVIAVVGSFIILIVTWLVSAWAEEFSQLRKAAKRIEEWLDNEVLHNSRKPIVNLDTKDLWVAGIIEKEEENGFKTLLGKRGKNLLYYCVPGILVWVLLWVFLL